MTFVHYPKKNLPKIKRKNIKGRRHYVDSLGNTYYSVTSVTGIVGKEGLDEWRNRLAERYGSVDCANAVADNIMITAGTNGTKVHKACEDYLNNKVGCTPQDILARGHFEQLKPYLDKISDIRGLEVQMFSKKLGLAGTVDCIANYDGEPAIIDFKTSKKLKPDEWIQNYYQQATAYSLMWEENTGQKITHIRIPMSAQDGTSECYLQDRSNFVDALHETIDKFKAQQDV